MCTYSNIICITNRHLSDIPFLERIEKIAKKHPKYIVLREKDLSENEYSKLAEEVMKICDRENVDLILHSFIDTAISLGVKNIHLPLYIAKEQKSKLKYFDVIGISTHSMEEAVEAENLGASYITAGHIFETDCKKGMKGRGLDFIKDITINISIPVYGIGGININNMDKVLKCGAEGVCIMSEFMKGNI
ncbi:thiamine phosphate synthase [Anaerofustis stercorihominis]|uniref:Thiamine-phosphate diphosphorylase n=2 Tax=Anaerofustis stercorihominis TaxID=214853 RepID=B1CBK4_9FIRM|nr:thiamine phosphate synthase [Anaerofustis stercorihominis]EDS71651.1 putative thiamine-phosphate diphosphorylase [Anaerofustis stercorihominis DSM 17244]MCQ4796291.1 thiamine phosphate synthase [Anaerofustis stercorihominis]RGD75274.1 thiamine phosphate synthase [Anaerofustis stercorihominis]